MSVVYVWNAGAVTSSFNWTGPTTSTEQKWWCEERSDASASRATNTRGPFSNRATAMANAQQLAGRSGRIVEEPPPALPVATAPGAGRSNEVALLVSKPGNRLALEQARAALVAAAESASSLSPVAAAAEQHYEHHVRPQVNAFRASIERTGPRGGA